MSVALADVAYIGLIVAILNLPGLAVCWAAGLRGWWLSIAPAASYGVLALSLSVADTFRFRWTYVLLVVATLIVAVIVWGCSRIRLARSEMPARWQWSARDEEAWESTPLAHITLLSAILIAGVAAAAVSYPYNLGLGAIHQEWDAAFHGAVLRALADVGMTTPEKLGEIIDPASADTFFYPIAAHSVAGLSMQAGASAPQALAALILAMPFLASISLGGLLRIATGRVSLAALSVLIMPMAASFPYDIMWRGPLTPYSHALATLPGLILATIALLERRNLGLAVLLGFIGAGSLMLHPSVVIAGMLIIVPMVISRMVVTRGATIIPDVTCAVVAGAFAVGPAWQTLVKATSASANLDVIDWPAIHTVPGAIAALIFNSHWRQDHYMVLGILLLCGVLVGWRCLRWVWWLVTGTLVLGVLYILAASDDSALSQTLTQPWWNDAYRLAAAFWMFAPVIVASTIVTFTDACLAIRARIHDKAQGSESDEPDEAESTEDDNPTNVFVFPGEEPPKVPKEVGSVPQQVVGGGWLASEKVTRRVRAGLHIAALTGVVVATSGGYASANAIFATKYFRNDTYVTDSERAAYKELRKKLPDDAVVLNDPNDGSVWMYSDTGINTVFKQRVGPLQVDLMTEQDRQLLKHIHQIDWNSDVQRAVVERGVTHVVLGGPNSYPAFRQESFVKMKSGKWLRPQPAPWPLRVWKVEVPEGFDPAEARG